MNIRIRGRTKFEQTIHLNKEMLLKKGVVSFIVVGTLLAMVGFGRDGGYPISAEIRNGLEVIRNPAAPLHPNRRVIFEDDLCVGPGQEGDKIQLFSPRAFAVDGKGLIYISDDQDPCIKVFSPDGRPLRTIGSKGNGPGEFQLITAAAFLPDGRLLVMDSDLRRISLFGPEGRFLTSHVWAMRSGSFRLYFATDSSYVREVTTVGPGSEPMTWKRFLKIAAFDLSGREILSYGDFDPAQSGFVAKKFSFSPPYPVCSVLAGDALNRRLYHCHNDKYTIQVFDAKGKIFREIERPYKRRRVTSKDWQDYLDGFGTSAENRADIEKAASKPEWMPVTPYMIVDDAGRLWVQLHEDETVGGRVWKIFDVFDDRGRYESRIRSPFVPIRFQAGKAYRFDTDEDTGERSLRRSRVLWRD